MSIPSIGAIGATGASATGALSSLRFDTTSSATSAATSPEATNAVFGTSLAGQVDSLQAMQANANTLAVQAVTGDLDDIHDYTIAATEASVAMEMTAALRNKAVEAFTEIMRMQA
jgi:flagellar hook-basal body complex protein FliE